MQSSHPSHLFQSDYSQATGQRRAARAASSVPLGNPIHLGKRHEQIEDIRLSGAGADAGKEKVLDALLVQETDTLWTAESGGIIRGTNLTYGRTTHILAGHRAPVGALALLRSRPINGQLKRDILISAGWDKCINFWDIGSASSETINQTDSTGPSSDVIRVNPLLSISEASNDFIKALHVVSSLQAASHPPVLLSGGSDRSVRVWDLSDLFGWLGADGVTKNAAPPTPKCIGTFAEHTRAVTCIASLTPLPASEDLKQATTSLPSTSSASASYPSIYTADSMGRIFELTLKIDDTEPRRAKLHIQRELRGPETTISSLVAGWAYCDDEDDDGQPIREAQIWAASNDKTAQLFLPRGAVQGGGRSALGPAPSGSQHQRSSNTGNILGSQPPLSPSQVIRQPEYVKAVLPLSLHIPAGLQGPQTAVITGGADEDVRTYQIDGQEPAKLIRRQQGHWHEVQWLGLWNGSLAAQPGPADRQNDQTSAGSLPSRRWFVISTGLDGSVRRWPLSDLLVAQSPQDGNEEEEARAQAYNVTTDEQATQQLSSNGQKAEPSQAATAASASQKTVGSKRGPGGMTAEEEAELDELLMDD
ncbi:unnamed protein product [Parajaminaea phylloscopi]